MARSFDEPLSACSSALRLREGKVRIAADLLAFQSTRGRHFSADLGRRRAPMTADSALRQALWRKVHELSCRTTRGRRRVAAQPPASPAEAARRQAERLRKLYTTAETAIMTLVYGNCGGWTCAGSRDVRVHGGPTLVEPGQRQRIICTAANEKGLHCCKPFMSGAPGRI